MSVRGVMWRDARFSAWLAVSIKLRAIHATMARAEHAGRGTRDEVAWLTWEACGRMHSFRLAFLYAMNRKGSQKPTHLMFDETAPF